MKDDDEPASPDVFYNERSQRFTTKQDAAERLVGSGQCMSYNEAYAILNRMQSGNIIVTPNGAMRDYGPSVNAKGIVNALKRSKIRLLKNLGKKLEKDLKEEFGAIDVPNNFTIQMIGCEYEETFGSDDD